MPWTPSLLRSPTGGGGGDSSGCVVGVGLGVCVGMALGGVSIGGVTSAGSVDRGVAVGGACRLGVGVGWPRMMDAGAHATGPISAARISAMMGKTPVVLRCRSHIVPPWWILADG